MKLEKNVEYIDETGFGPEDVKTIPAADLKPGDKVRVHTSLNVHGSHKEVHYEEVGSITLNLNGKEWTVWKPDGSRLTAFYLNGEADILK